ncbi:MAG: transglutaminase domain-containing protein [Chitinophagaceae bacterium]|nr:transglutaminase domain-containing protein [Chitinophagaceae bacterium]
MKLNFDVALVSVLFTLAACTGNKTFVKVNVDNPSFTPDTLFASFEDLSSPKFADLKTKYQLDTIFHGETDELRRILLLRHWISKTIKIQNDGPYPGNGTPESILDEALKGHGFHCGHYTAVQNAILNAYGYVTRCILADVGTPVDFIAGGGHHAINEVWLNSLHKWFLIDAKYDCHFEKSGIPLSALEIRDEYFRNKAADLEVVKGIDRVPATVFPELNYTPKENYARIYTWLSWGRYNNRYVNWPNTNTDLMVVYEDEYFKTHTWLWDGKPFWGYKPELMRRVQDRKAIEWTPNTIQSNVSIQKDQATIDLTSATPNLQTYQMKEPGGEWKDISKTVTVKLDKEKNEIIFRTMNKAGVTGAEHRVLIEESRG